MKFIFTSVLVLIAIYATYAQIKDYQTPGVVVTAARIPVSFSELTRSVYIITSEDIKNAPVNSIQDLLQYVAGLDVRQRGVEGVQADLSIRGGTFEESLIMVDGIKLTDPQTGHHDFNLPVSLDNVERIEILKGQGSKTFGANAFSGVVNIITKKDASRKISLQTSGGQHGYYQGALNTSYSFGSFNNHLSFSKNKSDGYRNNTDFDINNFSYNSLLKLGSSELSFLFGYDDKKFGANGFYSDLFPNQWEHTTTKLLGAGLVTGTDVISFTPKFYWRRNNDRYLLNFQNPSFYENNHQTDVYGFEVQSSLSTALGITSFGGEYTKDKIVSSNLGNHSRENKGVFAEHKFSPFEDVNVVAGAFVYDYSFIGWKFWPGLDLSYGILPNLRLFGSAGKAFRIPSYTELFYSDPQSQGNPNLHHEETVNYELGLNYVRSEYQFTLSIFRKEGKNIIDWVKNTEGGKWMAMNIAKLNTNGLEVGVKLLPQQIFGSFPVFGFSINYSYLDINRQLSDFTSRYVLDHLRQQVIIGVNNYLPFNIIQNWTFRYEDRIDFEDNFITDTQLSRNFELINIFLRVTNLFDIPYRDITSIPLPGRWITAGLNLNLNL